MKPSELRIGNWVNRKEPNGSNWIPVQVTLYYLGLMEKWKEDFQPVKLTQELLESFGFEKGDEEGEWYSAEGIFGVAFNHEVGEVKSKVPLVIWDAAFTGSPCLYVHQLQNLFFALTGSELTIKETVK